MTKTMPEVTRTAQDYHRIFETERRTRYPQVDAVEERMGFALEQDRLLEAARVLACPLKVNAPNWQHGRVLYAALRHRLAAWTTSAPASVLDIGTAKGFSALCMHWALVDSGIAGRVHSVDVVHPDAAAWRNTVAEVGRDQPLSLPEILAPWGEALEVRFHGMTGVRWLQMNSGLRLAFAFVDGKHDGSVVRQEASMIAGAQLPGDGLVFDDVHIPGVRAAAEAASRWYHQDYVELIPGKRAYLICERK